MADTFIVMDQIQIQASVEKVWEVLTNPEYIRQWDDLPENYNGGNLQLNSVIDWEGHSILTVTQLEKNRFLKINMVLPKVPLDPSQYDVSYKYTLTGNEHQTNLSFEIGDFAPLPKPQDYLDATLEFLQTAKEKIKDLAEALN